jgi:hypothetical protein
LRGQEQPATAQQAAAHGVHSAAAQHCGIAPRDAARPRRRRPAPVAAAHSSAQVLGSGSLSKALTIKADAFSASASEKIGAAGGSAEAAAAKIKWTRRAHEKRVKELVAAGLDPKKEAAKAKAARAAAKKK